MAQGGDGTMGAFVVIAEFRVRPDPDFIAEARSVLGGTAALL